jgi:pimeloyl-ACP methyl ester carboxylesterase
MTTYVLVPGAWLGGWVWQDTARALRSKGHDAYPVTLTGLGDRSHLARRDTDLDTHIQDVVNVLEYEDLHDVVLVGHSYAGIVVTGVADSVPERLSRLVYLDSGPFPDGWCFLDFSDAEGRAAQEADVKRAGDGWLLPVPAPDKLGGPSGIGDFSDRERELFRTRAVPHPFGSYRQPIKLRGTFDGQYQRIAVVAGGLGVGFDGFMKLIDQGVPAFAPLAEPDWRFLALDTGHWPMLTAAGKLADLLDDLDAARPRPATESARR